MPFLISSDTAWICSLAVKYGFLKLNLLTAESVTLPVCYDEIYSISVTDAGLAVQARNSNNKYVECWAPKAQGTCTQQQYNRT